MKNVTITLNEDVARWARLRAAEQNTSVSRLVGEMLRDYMQRDRTYRAAMRAYLERPAAVLRESGTPYPSRDSVHDRADLR